MINQVGMTKMECIKQLLGNLVSEDSPSPSSSNRPTAALLFYLALFAAVGLAQISFAETQTSPDVTERDAGAEHKCVRTNGQCTYDPRTDYWSYPDRLDGTDDDIVYFDQHGNLNDGNEAVSHGGARDSSFSIMNDISTFMTEEQMLQGFTMDASVGLRDRNYVGGDPFTLQIKVTDGTTTYSDTQNYTTSAGQDYTTITQQMIVPENTLSYSLATFGLILDGASLTNGYNGPQTNAITLTSTWEVINNVQDTVLDLVSNAVDDIISDTGVISTTSANMEIDVQTASGNQTINVGVVGSPSGITISVPTTSGGMDKMEINTGMTSADSPAEPVAEVAEAIAEVQEAQQESSSDEKEEKEESKETKADKAKAVQAIVTRVLQAVQMAGGDSDGTKLALMGILGTPGFRSYQQQEIPDAAFYDTTVAYESEQIPDLLGGIFNLGSDQMMDAMTDAQYK